MLFYVSLIFSLSYLYFLYIFVILCIFLPKKVDYVTFSSYICTENGKSSGRCTAFHPVLEGKYTDKIEKVNRKFIF